MYPQIDFSLENNLTSKYASEYCEAIKKLLIIKIFSKNLRKWNQIAKKSTVLA